MPCEKSYVRIRSKDIGRPGHHYVRFGITGSGRVEPIGGLRKYKGGSDMARKRRRKSHKVGSSWITTRKVGKHRRRVRVTRVTKKRYKTRVVSRKKKRRRR